MIWAALATAIMLSSGEGDDFGAVFRFLEMTRAELPAVIADPDRRSEAVLALADVEVVVHYSMVSARIFSECLEVADRDYRATREDYDRCGTQYESSIEELGRRYTAARLRFEAAIQPSENAALERRIRAKLQE
jgi:hypothetical protein